MDAVVDGNLPDDIDSASIFSKLIGHKPSDSYSGDLYMRCGMDFVADTVQTRTPQFMDMGLSTINTLDERSGLSNPTTRILRPMDGAHWGAPDHVFGEVTSVVVSEAKLDHDYYYKTEFQVWKYKKEFEHQNIFMS